MADNSNKRSKKSKRAKKRGPSPATITATNNRERTVNLPRLDAIERVPSNAPTMAIAPSDYEHIFHEAPAGPQQQQQQQVKPDSPAPSPGPPPAGSPGPVPVHRTAPPPPARLPLPPQSPPPSPFDNLLTASGANQAPVQVTPDGYTLLGQPADAGGGRRVPLPAHIVRASNQFSRAALARVARYLASRAEASR